MLTSSHTSPVIIRDASDSDLAAISDIYRHYVLHELATFELEPPSEADMAARRQAVLGAGLPWLVAEHDGRIAGYCYATPYRPRPAYRHSIEESIYLAHGSGGLGIGSRLMSALLSRCEQGPWRQMLAVIAMPGENGNQASLALHRRFGFEQAGLLSNVGYKHGRWIDTLLMQRAIGPGASLPPAEPDRRP